MIKCMGGVNDAVDQIDFRLNQYSTKFIQPRGWGGEVSPRKSLVQSACQYEVTSRVNNFQNGEQSVHRRDG